ncbi:hypothetical protein KC717_03960 [Candidatus Dojkabacteria bacterium]|uniref:ArsR family transcriptional regulator n=1 Tax=Candidatus Dojkabacteria bacterium TaxID=2099670 RepID=A0A955L8R5_9BACT|nr:hypothetical protein [Candidatus Dojkabacteria bacterium]
MFVSKVRIKCLKYFFNNPDVPIHLRAAARELREEINAVRRELMRLQEIKLLKSEKRGNKKYFSLNRHFPFFEELNAMMQKSSGLGEAIIKAQNKVGTIYFAALMNNYATSLGAVTPTKEIDFVIVGDVDMNALGTIVQGEEEEIGREINYTVLKLSEFNLRKKRRDPFIISMLLNTHVLLIGSREDYVLH